MTKSELLQVAKPILFNAEMVRAILEGRKSCTRRVIKHDNNGIWSAENDCRKSEYGASVPCYLNREIPVDDTSPNVVYPKYDVGDYLYVRETWRKCIGGELHYKADPPPQDKQINQDAKWHPSIHMPSAAARIFLRVTDVRAERLQDITNNDCHKEGINESGSVNFGSHYNPQKYDFSIEKYQTLWDSTVKKQDLDHYGWRANPWVWVIDFERVEVDE